MCQKTGNLKEALMATLQTAARIIGSVQTVEPVSEKSVSNAVQAELFSDQELFGVEKGQYIKKTRNGVLADIDALEKGARWDDIVGLYHPVEEKLPDLVRADAAVQVRRKLAFALGQLGRFDEAIKELEICVDAEPDNFLSRSSLAYTAYNSLYEAKNKKMFLAGKAKADRIALAHAHFKKAQELRPDGVTCFYRRGMLFSQIENKPNPGLEQFEKAVANWETLSDAQRSDRHQEKKNYIKSVYRSASLLLAAGNGGKALERISLCLQQDEQTQYISLAFKYFALGKIHFQLDRFDDAKNALLFALQSSGKGASKDFIHELLARTYLALGKPDKAQETIDGIPERFRRPYYRWTEADVLCTAGRFDKARQILEQVCERDSRSRHVSLIRLAKIEYTRGDWAAGMTCADKACQFFSRTFGNVFYEGLFWQSFLAFKAGQVDKADQLLSELESSCRFYPKLDRLRAMVRNQSN